MRSVLFFIFLFVFTSDGFSQAAAKSPELNLLLDSVIKNINSGDYTSAERWLSEAKLHVNSETSEGDYFRFRYKEGLLFLSRRQLDKANPVLLECLELARKSGDSSRLMVANATLAELKSEQALYGASAVYGETALSYFNRTDSMPYYGLLMSISNALVKKDTQKSLQYALACKDFYEREGHDLELGLTLNNIGEIYREQFKEYHMAEKHYRKAIGINLKNEFNAGLAANYLNMAINYSEIDQIDSSLKYIDLSLTLRSSMGDIGGMAIVYNSLGRINLFNGNPEAAKKAFFQTIKISEEHAIYPGLYYGNRGLGETYFQMGSNTLAKKYYTRSLQVAKHLKAETLIADSYISLYEIEKEDGNFKAALNYFETYSALADSLGMKEKESDLAELKTLYETDLANKENMILKADQLSQSAEIKQQRLTAIGLWVGLGLVLFITSILFIGYIRRSKMLKKEATLHQKLQSQHQTLQHQKEELKDLNELKSSILSVLGHDLRAPLTSISSLVSLMNSGDLKQEEFVNLTQHLDQETKAGLISLQNILMWSQGKAVSAKPEIEDLSVSLIVDECLKNNRREIENKALRISTQWDYARIISADKNQFQSIVFNLLSNAIKFSPKGEKIVLQTLKDSEGIHFSVSNAGEPISEELNESINGGTKITSNRGTLGEKGTGIGLRIVSDFAKLHGGYLKLQTNADGRNEAVVFFPFRSSELRVSA